MRRTLSVIASAALLLMALGCGGSGDNSIDVSPFVGDYQGSFTSSNTGDNGTVTMSVDDAGNVTGTLVDDSYTPPLTESMTGVIQDNGDFSGDLDDNAGTSPFGGALGFDNTGHLSGQVNITTTPGVINALFDLADVTPAAKIKKGNRARPHVKNPANARPILK